jgi:hypothetical protein
VSHLRTLLTVASLVFGLACCASRAPQGDPELPLRLPGAYPAAFAKLDQDEVTRRQRALSARTPAWSVDLDPAGLLIMATCDACPISDVSGAVITAEDRAAIDMFVAAHAPLLNLDAPWVVKMYDGERGIVFQQRSAGEIIGRVAFVRFFGRLLILGHMWRDLPAPGVWLDDAALEEKLRAIDASPELARVHGFVQIVRGIRDPLEIHEVACLLPKGSSMPVMSPVPLRRPCVDARTGEDLTERPTTWPAERHRGPTPFRMGPPTPSPW